jgi:hypothetical protein
MFISQNSPVLYQSYHLGITAPIHAAVGVLMVLGLLLCLPKFRGTTLVAPCLWAILSAFAIAVGDAWMGSDAADQTTFCFWQPVIQYVSACTSFCPVMAVLGAKRPQDGPWQWIVLSLWIVLVLPALQFILLPAGPRFELFAAWKIFLIGLMSLGLLNWLPTKYWLAGCCFCAGQLALFWETLARMPAIGPLLSGTSNPWGSLGSWLFFAAFVLVTLISVLSTKGVPTDRPTLEGPDSQGDLIRLNRRWLEFRDRYGSFWGLRILQRVNQTAAISQWPVRLQWWGFEQLNRSDPIKNLTVTSTQISEIDRTLNNLLRRFL